MSVSDWHAVKVLMEPVAKMTYFSCVLVKSHLPLGFVCCFVKYHHVIQLQDPPFVKAFLLGPQFCHHLESPKMGHVQQFFRCLLLVALFIVNVIGKYIGHM